MKKLFKPNLVGLLGVLAAVLWCGCGSVRRGEPITGPLDISDPSVAKGRLVFMNHCHECHPGGEGGLGPGINDKPLPAFLIKTQVRLGMGVMPSFGEKEISAEELAQLTAYIAELRKQEPSVANR